MEGRSEVSPKDKVRPICADRRRCDEIYRMAARYARAKAIARRVPGFEAECEKLEIAFSKALYNAIVERRGR